MEIWCFLYVGKGGISFSYKYEITLLSKKQRWSFPEITPRDDISGINEKDDIHPRKAFPLKRVNTIINKLPEGKPL